MAYIPVNKTPTKKRLEEILLKYLSNPDNKPLNRTELAMEVCGYKTPNALYIHFTSGELSKIETVALAIRRSRYSTALSLVDQGILKEGAKGVPGAAKLCYQRFEDWSEKQRVEGKITFETVLNDMIDVTPTGGESGKQTADNSGDSAESVEIVED